MKFVFMREFSRTLDILSDTGDKHSPCWSVIWIQHRNECHLVSELTLDNIHRAKGDDMELCTWRKLSIT